MVLCSQAAEHSHLAFLREQEQAWDEGSMYAFTYDRPTPIWYYLAIVLLPVVSVLCDFAML